MSIGYACLAVGVPGSGMKRTILKHATEERLLELIGHNLGALEVLIDYNIRNGIKLFRISSDLIPFGSSLAYQLPWESAYEETLNRIGEKIKRSGLRVSLHPGQYTVLNSPDEGVVERAILDLEYHARILDALGTDVSHKLILHLGGVYGDKPSAKERFSRNYQRLSSKVKQRLVLENDDRLYTIEDVLEMAARDGIPVAYDNLHNHVNPSDPRLPDSVWVEAAAATWSAEDGQQKIHYSQQDPKKKPGAHSQTIAVDPFLAFYEELDGRRLDIMLEVKDKNISALKCIHVTEDRKVTGLEQEWARWKYQVLEHSPSAYQAVRTLLKDKQVYSAAEFYRLIERSQAEDVMPGHAVNAAQHVWGYFKTKAAAAESKRFAAALSRLASGEADSTAVKRLLLSLAKKYEEEYLLSSYYLYMG